MPPTADEATTRRSMRFGALTQKHPEYDASLLEEIETLYVGGYALRKKADKFLPALVDENPRLHDQRKASVAYQNYFGQIVDQFCSDLFSQPLTVAPAADASDDSTPGDVPDRVFYPAFEKDADRRGQAFADLAKSVMSTALKQRRGILAIDAPNEEPAESKAIEDAKAVAPNEKARIYAYELPIETLIDWRDDDIGGFRWAIVWTTTNERKDPSGDRAKTIETFMVWSFVGGVACWERYESTWGGDVPKPTDETLIPLVDAGATKFRRIPLIRLELPEGLWVGNKIGPQALEHFQRRSELVSAEKRSLVAIPYIKRGPEIGAPGESLVSVTQENPHRGANPVEESRRRGWVGIGSGDDLGFAEPEGKCYELVDRQLKDLKTEMFRVCHQMAASVDASPAALGRSGESKQEDGAATAIVLGALGNYARTFALAVYKTISEARGENVSWTAHGLDSFEVDDRAQVLEEALDVDQIGIPSPTFKRHYKYNLATKLIGTADPQTLATIKQEIEDGVEAETEMKDLEREARQDAINNPPDPNAAPAAPPVAAPRPPPTNAPKKKPPPKKKAGT